MDTNLPMAVATSEAYDLRPIPIQKIIERRKSVVDLMKSVMTEGVHYGTLPGCGDKRSLAQAGAQALTSSFQLVPTYPTVRTEYQGEHITVNVLCSLRTLGGVELSQGVGLCTTLESKYRFRKAARKCPECGKESIIKGRDEYGGGWVCFTKKDGCGAKFKDGYKAIEDQQSGLIENDKLADVYNTVVKMSKKRAFVDATITALGVSDLFTQDMDDIDISDLGTPEPTTSPRQQPRQQTKADDNGVILDDDVPPWWNEEPKLVKPVPDPKPAPTVKPRAQKDDPETKRLIRDAIDGEDWYALGEHIITSKCSGQTLTVREYCEGYPEVVAEVCKDPQKLKLLNWSDGQALFAYWTHANPEASNEQESK